MEFAEDMKPGAEVTIFRDPLEETQREGTARLIEKLDTAHGIQQWRVRFQPPFEQPLVRRIILVLEPGQKVGNGISRMNRV